MKRKTIILLSSVLAGSLLVGGAFAAYAVTDNADPIGVDVKTQAPDQDTPVTLTWGAKEHANIPDLDSGKYAKAGYFTVKSDIAYEGIFSVKMEDKTPQAIIDAKGTESPVFLFDNLEVFVYSGNVVLTDGELPAELPAGVELVGSISTNQAAVDGVKKWSKTVASDLDGKVFSVLVKSEATDAVLGQLSQDVVRLTIDWGMGADSHEAEPPAPTVVPDYCLWGTTDGTNWNSLGTLVAKDEHEYKIEGIQLAKDTEFTIHMAGDTYREFSDIKPASPAYADFKVKGGEEAISQNNLVVVNSDTFDIYVDTIADDNGDYIWLVKHSSTPVVSTYSATKNGDPFVLTDYTGEKGDNNAVFTAELAKDDKLVMFNGTTALKLGDTENSEYTAPKAGEYTIYVNKEDKVYITSPTELTEIAVNLGDYATADAVCFVNYWGGTAGVGSAKVTAGKAAIDGSATGLLVVRCMPGAESVIWSGDGANVWNQSEDLDVTPADLVKTLTFDHWVEKANDVFTWVA